VTGHNVLLVGGHGFIGKRVFLALKNAGYNPGIFDTHDHPTDRDGLSGCSAVVHLAAIGGLALTLKEPGRILEHNFNAAMAWRHVKVPMVLVSSFSVYGSVSKFHLPICSDVKPKPVDAYGASKLIQELVFAGMPNVKILRLSSVYGPGMNLDDPQTIVARLARWAKDGSCATLHEDGLQTRDFVHVDDVAGCVVRMIERPDPSHIMNVCTGQPTSLLEAWRHLSKIAGRSSCEFTLTHETHSLMRDCLGDSTACEQLLGHPMRAFTDSTCADFWSP